MKLLNNKFYGLLLGSLLVLVMGARAQSNEVQQLLLNVEKLSQLKNILSDMKRGYTMLYQGYHQVKNVAQGNFKLHEVFLDGLLLVSPEVKKYHKVAEIVKFQKLMLSDVKLALKGLSTTAVFSIQDLDYLEQVYGKVHRESLQLLDRLLMVITANQLRMSDEERLKAIDSIHAEMSEKLVFLRAFHRDAALLARQRTKEKAEVMNFSEYYQPR